MNVESARKIREENKLRVAKIRATATDGVSRISDSDIMFLLRIIEGHEMALEPTQALINSLTAERNAEHKEAQTQKQRAKLYFKKLKEIKRILGQSV